jgi:hypothetical protein
MLDRAIFGKGARQFRQVVIVWVCRKMAVRVRAIPLGGVVILKFNFVNSHAFNPR